MKPLKPLLLIGGVLLLTQANSSFAAFEMISTATEVKTTTQTATTVQTHANIETHKLTSVYTVAEVGKGYAGQSNSLGNQIPLDTAMSMIMPDGWQFLPAQNVGNPEVSWKKAKTWIDSIGQIAFYGKMHFTVDWNKQIVFATKEAVNNSPASKSSPTPVAPQLYQNNSMETVIGGFGRNSLQNVVHSILPRDWRIDIPTSLAPVNVKWKGGATVLNILSDVFKQAGANIKLDYKNKTVQVQYLKLREGQKLSDELKRWAKKEQWTFMWRLENEDYMIESDTYFTGDFKSAFFNVVKAYQENGALLNCQPEASRANKTARLKVHKEI